MLNDLRQQNENGKIASLRPQIDIQKVAARLINLLDQKNQKLKKFYVPNTERDNTADFLIERLAKGLLNYSGSFSACGETFYFKEFDIIRMNKTTQGHPQTYLMSFNTLIFGLREKSDDILADRTLPAGYKDNENSLMKFRRGIKIFMHEPEDISTIYLAKEVLDCVQNAHPDVLAEYICYELICPWFGQQKSRRLAEIMFEDTKNYENALPASKLFGNNPMIKYERGKLELMLRGVLYDKEWKDPDIEEAKKEQLQRAQEEAQASRAEKEKKTKEQEKTRAKEEEETRQKQILDSFLQKLNTVIKALSADASPAIQDQAFCSLIELSRECPDYKTAAMVIKVIEKRLTAYNSFTRYHNKAGDIEEGANLKLDLVSALDAMRKQYPILCDDVLYALSLAVCNDKDFSKLNRPTQQNAILVIYDILSRAEDARILHGVGADYLARHSMANFMELKDIIELLYISGHKTAISLIKFIAENGTGINDGSQQEAGSFIKFMNEQRFAEKIGSSALRPKAHSINDKLQKRIELILDIDPDKAIRNIEYKIKSAYTPKDFYLAQRLFPVLLYRWS